MNIKSNNTIIPEQLYLYLHIWYFCGHLDFPWTSEYDRWNTHIHDRFYRIDISI